MNLSWKTLSFLAIGAVVLMAQAPRRVEADDEEAYVIVSGDSLNMNGSSTDARRARMLRDKVQGDYIWFERDLKFYYITDAAVVARAKELFRPQEELGRKQEELGKQQAKLGEDQARVTASGDFSAQMDDLQRQIDALEKEVATNKGYTQEDLGNLQGKIGDLQGRIGELQGKAGEQQGKLGEQQGKLGEQQGKLGEEQGRLAEIASKKMKALLDQALRDGVARPVNLTA